MAAAIANDPSDATGTERASMTATATHTVDTLAVRFDALESHIERLVDENHALREALATHAASSFAVIEAPADQAIERLSRRWLLRRGLQAAAASAAAGVLLQRDSHPAAAASFDHLIVDNPTSSRNAI